MGVWSSVDYTDDYQWSKIENLNVFCSAVQERWDLLPGDNWYGAVAPFSDTLQVTLGWGDDGPPITHGQIVQGTSGGADYDGFFALPLMIAQVISNFFDPNYIGGYPAGYVTGAGLLYDGLFGAGGNAGATARLSCSLDVIKTGDDTQIWRKSKPRQISTSEYDIGPTFSASADVDGNSAAIGQRAYTTGLGLPVKCTSTDTWTRDLGGPVDIVDNTMDAPDGMGTATGNTGGGFDATDEQPAGAYIQFAYIWDEFRAVCNVMDVARPYWSTTQNQLGAVGSASSTVSWAAAQAATTLGADAAGGAGGEAMTMVSYGDDIGQWETSVASASTALLIYTRVSCHLQLNKWAYATLPVGFGGTLSFDANGQGVVQDSYNQIGDDGVTGGGNLPTPTQVTAQFGPVSPSAHGLPDWCEEPTSGEANAKGFSVDPTKFFVVVDAGISGGFTYQSSTD